MRYWILGLLLAMAFSCSKQENASSQSNSASTSTYDLTTAEGLCYYVMDQADKATGDKAVQKIVTDAYRTTTCPDLKDDYIPQWQCMKKQIDLGVGFDAADEHCAN